MESFNPVYPSFLFLITFPVMWCGIVWLMAHLGGWARLGQHYGTHQTPRGESFRYQSGMIGWISYRGILQVHDANDGVFLSMPWPFRVGHPPLFIPWTAMHDASELQLLWMRFVRFAVGSPAMVRMRLPAKVFDAVEAGHGVVKASADASRSG